MWEFEWEGETYNIQNKIGQGYTAEVYKATSKKKLTLCVKIINDQFYKQTISKNLIDNQVEILSKLNHPNILKFIKKEHKKKLMIITEYCAGGTLYQMLTKKGKFTLKQSIPIIKQIIEGCIYLHSQGYIHRDLKPQNIFFNQKDRSDVKIADFGFAVSLKDVKLMSANVGSPLYMPFEALNEMKFSKQSDIFAIGVIWYELLTGKTPFQARTEIQLKQKIKVDKVRDTPLQCDTKLKDLIFRCLRKNVFQRPSLQELLSALKPIILESQRKPCISFIDTGFNLPKKSNKQSKQNYNPLPNQAGLNKTIRSKTSFETLPLKPIKKAELNQSNIQSNLKVESKKAKPNSASDFPNHLSKLIQSKLSFLPKSIQSKYISVLKLYQQLLTGQMSLLKGGQQTKQDQLIKSLNVCQTEKEFCMAASNFLRRLLRLARTYKQFGSCVVDLSILWNRVESIIA